jgi:hypothetical protein
MSDDKKEKTGELDEEQLESVSGGVGVAGGGDAIADGGASQTDSATGKVKFNEFTIKKTTDKSSSSF